MILSHSVQSVSLTWRQETGYDVITVSLAKLRISLAKTGQRFTKMSLSLLVCLYSYFPTSCHHVVLCFLLWIVVFFAFCLYSFPLFLFAVSRKLISLPSIFSFYLPLSSSVSPHVQSHVSCLCPQCLTFSVSLDFFFLPFVITGLWFISFLRFQKAEVSVLH